MLMMFKNDICKDELKQIMDDYIKNSKSAIQIKFTNIDFNETIISDIICCIKDYNIPINKTLYENISILDLVKFDIIILEGAIPSSFVNILRVLIEQDTYEALKSKLIIGTTDDKIIVQKDLEVNNNFIVPNNQIRIIKRNNRIANLAMGVTLNYEKLKNYLNFDHNDYELQDSIIQAFQLLYHNDYFLIDNTFLYTNPRHRRNGKHYVGERTIVFRFAYYLQFIISQIPIFDQYVVDCEYNRNNNGEKRTENFPNGVYPDLIVHERGSNKNNLLIMEFKTHWNRRNQRDILKIKDFVAESGDYHFKYGIAATIGKKCPEIICIDGETGNIS